MYTSHEVVGKEVRDIMCRAVDVASYLLREKGRLSCCELRVLLSYSQAWCLVTQDRPLFSEEIRAGEHGPVVSEVFVEHTSRRNVVQADLGGSPDALTPEDLAVVDAVLDSYGRMGGEALEDLSRQEGPWRKAYDGSGGARSPIISNEAMVSYYSLLMSSDRQTAEAHHVPRFSYAPRMFVSDAEYDWLASMV